jgi:hypothetical protein
VPDGLPRCLDPHQGTGHPGGDGKLRNECRKGLGHTAGLRH